MSLKTEYSYNEDDFIQNANGMQELTVTVTLCEYRNLVEERAYSEKAIDKLQEENKNLKKQNETYQKFIIANHPEIIEKLGNLADMLTKGVTSDHQTEKGGEG